MRIQILVRRLIGLDFSAAAATVAGSVGGNDRSPLFELARVFVRINHIASIIVNANHGIM
jgi:hypothetical protein